MPSPPLEPVAENVSSGRIAVLDVLRGWALVGMLVVHASWYADSTAAGAALMRDAVTWGFENKFYPLFAFLFGCGFAVQMERAEARGSGFVPIYVRRLLGLALIGLLVKVFTGYEVLISYAIGGFVLLALRQRSERVFLIAALVAMLAYPLRPALTLAVESFWLDREASNAAAERDRAENQARRETLERVQREGTYADHVRAQLADVRDSYSSLRGWMPNPGLAMMLLGTLAVRRRYLAESGKHRRAIACFGVVFVLMFLAGLTLSALLTFPPSGYVRLDSTVARLPGFLLSELWLGLAYACGVALLFQRESWRARLEPLSWAGRMALTNYVVQVCLLELLFAPYLLALAFPPALVFPFAALALCLQIAFSRWWLARFRFGPMEWLWRSLTYGKLQPMRAAAAASKS
jgi:uncharacterized protein